jgi:hypothetical protein
MTELQRSTAMIDGNITLVGIVRIARHAKPSLLPRYVLSRELGNQPIG